MLCLTQRGSRGREALLPRGRQLLLVLLEAPDQVPDAAGEHAEADDGEDDEDDDHVEGGQVQRDVGGPVRAGLLVPAELAVADRVAHEVGVDAGCVVTIVLNL